MDPRVAGHSVPLRLRAATQVLSSSMNATPLGNIDGPSVLEGKENNLFSSSLSDQFVLSGTVRLGLNASPRACSDTVAKGPLVEYNCCCPQALLSLPFLSPSAPNRYYSHALARKTSTESPIIFDINVLFSVRWFVHLSVIFSVSK